MGTINITQIQTYIRHIWHQYELPFHRFMFWDKRATLLNFSLDENFFSKINVEISVETNIRGVFRQVHFSTKRKSK